MLIDDIQGARVLVIGDIMVDHFVAGSVDRVSPEAPALVLRIESKRSMLGGAANVAANIASLGGVAVLVGVVGEDNDAKHLSDLIGAFDTAVVDAMVRSSGVKTTCKTRYIAGDRHLMRADSESLGVSDEVQEAVISTIQDRVAGCDAVVVSDYAKGVLSEAVMKAAVSAAKDCGIPLIADPKRRDFVLYAGADLLTPNCKELEFATGEPCHDLAGCGRAAHQVMELTGASVLLTRSENGVALFQKTTPAWSESAQTKVVRDVSGAGDTVLAVCAVALAAGVDLTEASHMANVAAALAVGKSGTSCVTSDELNFALLHSPDADALSGKLVSMASAASISDIWRSQGYEIGFTNGCFDLLHPGHIKLLAEARGRCDRLVVGLNTDDSVRRLKGSERPIQTELARAEVIGALRSVDLVVLFSEDTPIDLIAKLRPSLLIKGADYTVETVVGADLVKGWGGRVETIDLVAGESSSKLIAASQREADSTH
jgi:D-beta-D-heptose 7-phosphate kinase/D-beta-D-heptose 1-phosphate adenosyltransferase